MPVPEQHSMFHLHFIQPTSGKRHINAVIRRKYPLFPGKRKATQSCDVLPPDLFRGSPESRITLAGMAYPPRNKLHRELLVEIQLGKLHQQILVSGVRKTQLCRGSLAFDSPRPFRAIPLDIAHAFGGHSRNRFYPLNPLGMGFRWVRNRSELAEVPLPHLENPLARIEPCHMELERWDEWRRIPPPWHCGFVPQSFPDQYQPLRQQAPLLPGSILKLSHTHPQHPKIEVLLPEKNACAWILLNQQPMVFPMEMRDLHIEPSKEAFWITWRGGTEIARHFDCSKTQTLCYGHFEEESWI